VSPDARHDPEPEKGEPTIPKPRRGFPRAASVGVLFVLGVGVLGVCIGKVCRPQESMSGGVSEGELQHTQATEPERAHTQNVMDAGLLKRIDTRRRQVFVDPAVWSMLDQQTKARAMRRYSAYFQPSREWPRVRVRSCYSGETLGEAGLPGIRIKR